MLSISILDRPNTNVDNDIGYRYDNAKVIDMGIKKENDISWKKKTWHVTSYYSTNQFPLVQNVTKILMSTTPRNNDEFTNEATNTSLSLAREVPPKATASMIRY